MKEITKYVCDDGTEFDFENEALEYEFNCFKNNTKILFYNIDGELMKIESRNTFEDCFYMYIPEGEDMELLAEMCGFEIPSGSGLWHYSESDAWVSPQQEIEKLKEKWKIPVDWKSMV